MNSSIWRGQLTKRAEPKHEDQDEESKSVKGLVVRYNKQKLLLDCTYKDLNWSVPAIGVDPKKRVQLKDLTRLNFC